MSEFILESTVSSAKLTLTEIRGDYFKVIFEAPHLRAFRKVCSYTDNYGFVELLEKLALYTKPWEGTESWEGIEGDFKLSVSCDPLGHVTFDIRFQQYGCAEEWCAEVQIQSEFGQLENLAKRARLFFGTPSPS